MIKEKIDIWKRSSYIYHQTGLDEPFKSNLWSRPITKERIGVYKKTLSKDEINSVNKYCHAIINFFNY